MRGELGYRPKSTGTRMNELTTHLLWFKSNLVHGPVIALSNTSESRSLVHSLGALPGILRLEIRPSPGKALDSPNTALSQVLQRQTQDLVAQVPAPPLLRQQKARIGPCRRIRFKPVSRK